MKRIVICSALLLAVLLSAPAWSHHAAEGIVSDEIWQMIDDQLESVDSPHLNIDFDDVMGSMSVATDDDGDMYLVSYIVADPEDVNDYLLYIDTAIEAVNQLPSGDAVGGRASTAYTELFYRDDGFVEILLYEPIGNGNSQTVPVSVSTPGKRN